MHWKSLNITPFTSSLALLLSSTTFLKLSSSLTSYLSSLTLSPVPPIPPLSSFFPLYLPPSLPSTSSRLLFLSPHSSSSPSLPPSISLSFLPLSVLNGRISRELGFEKTFVPPGPGDEGVAVGCALYGLQVVYGMRNTGLCVMCVVLKCV